LRRRSSAKQIKLIGEEYRDPAMLGSPRRYASVLDQIDVLIAMAGGHRPVAKDLSALRRKHDEPAGKKGKK